MNFLQRISRGELGSSDPNPLMLPDESSPNQALTFDNMFLVPLSQGIKSRNQKSGVLNQQQPKGRLTVEAVLSTSAFEGAGWRAVRKKPPLLTFLELENQIKIRTAKVVLSLFDFSMCIRCNCSSAYSIESSYELCKESPTEGTAGSAGAVRCSTTRDLQAELADIIKQSENLVESMAESIQAN